GAVERECLERLLESLGPDRTAPALPPVRAPVARVIGRLRAIDEMLDPGLELVRRQRREAHRHWFPALRILAPVEEDDVAGTGPDAERRTGGHVRLRGSRRVLEQLAVRHRAAVGDAQLETRELALFRVVGDLLATRQAADAEERLFGSPVVLVLDQAEWNRQ